jgi:hypothetical protein
VWGYRQHFLITRATPFLMPVLTSSSLRGHLHYVYDPSFCILRPLAENPFLPSVISLDLSLQSVTASVLWRCLDERSVAALGPLMRRRTCPRSAAQNRLSRHVALLPVHKAWTDFHSESRILILIIHRHSHRDRASPGCTAIHVFCIQTAYWDSHIIQFPTHKLS